MHPYRRPLVLLLLLVLCTLAIPETKAQISDIAFQLKNDKVHITYTASVPAYHRLDGIQVYASINGKIRQIPPQYLSGDTGAITASGHKEIIWDCFSENNTLPIEGAVFFSLRGTLVRLPSYITHQNIFYFEYIADPRFYFGVGIGYGRKAGGYVRFSLLPDYTFSIDAPGSSGAGYKTKYPEYKITAGIFLRATPWLRFNAGLGAGSFADTQNYYGCKGLAYEGNLTFSLFKRKWLGLTAGYCGIVSHKKSLASIQAGISFNIGIH